jgi:AcrR family transcriptional regulator
MNVHSVIEVTMTKEDKREAILQATMGLVAEHGFHGAPCAMIAEQAGVAAGTIYRYFENKDVLINELYSELEKKIYAVISAEYPTERPLRERFLHLGVAFLGYMSSSPLEYKFIEQFHNSPYGAAFRRDKILGEAGNCDIYRTLFNQGIEQQVIKEFPLVILYDLAFGPMMAVARNHILGFIELNDELIRKIAEACWDSLKQ